MTDYILYILTVVVIFAVLGVTYNLIMGYAGIISLAHAVFFGTGGYVTSLLMLKLGVSFFPTVIAGIIAGGALGSLFMFIIGRVRGDYLVVVTLGLQMIFLSILINWRSVTQGAVGVNGVPRPQFFGYVLETPVSYGIFSLIICAVVVAIAWWVSRSPFGRSLKAIRENDHGAQSLGKNVFKSKLIIFAISCALASVAGSLYAPFQQYINPNSFGLWQSIMILVIVVVGGAGSYWGAIIGAFVLVSLPEALRFIPITSGITAQLREIIFGLALLTVLFLRPQGLLGEYSFGAVRRVKKSKPSANPQMAEFHDEQLLSCVGHTVDGTLEPAEGDTTLRVSAVSKSFGGIHAVQNLSFSLKRGEIVGVIGPNGAGKSTLFDLICGFTSVDSGSVYYKGVNITNNKPYENARLGIGRSFQDLNVFPRLSTLDNVMVALQPPCQDDGILGIFHPKAVAWNKENKERGIEFLDAVGLAGRSRDLAVNLSYADQKLLILARLLAMKSMLLLLDELAAGLDPQSMNSLARLVKKIPQSGVDICLVEHSLDFVRATVDRILFLDQGQLIAEGTTEEITKDAKLTQIYFGSLA